MTYRRLLVVLPIIIVLAGSLPSDTHRRRERLDDVTGQVVAAINAGTQSARVTLAEMKSRFLPALLAAAGELSMLVSR